MRAFCRGALGALTIIALLGLWTGAATAQRRVALVIGNSAYVNTARLENPKNDAADMAETLKQLGFEMIEGRDLDKASMDRTIRNFAETLAGAQMALFFYAGHGLQVGGQNYLVPIDARLASAAALDFEMVRLDLIQRTMEREAPTNVVILDACRDNPLSRNLARALGTRSTSIGKGLAAVESGEGTLISYSTQPGNVALDGTGRNSPFAAALLKHIPAVGDDLPTILINVRNDVMAATERRQVPWEHSALTAKVFFKPPKPTGPTVDQQIEMSFWDAVKDTHNPAVLQTYLDRYPNGEFATIARALIEHYEQKAKAEQAARAEEQKRQEEARKAAEVKRLEDERRANEEALVAERRRARDTNDTKTERQIDEKSQAEAVARSEMLRKALEEVIVAREAAKAAEEQRLAAVKAAEEATKAAERTIAAKRTTDAADPTKVAALPKLEKPASSGPADGAWTVVWIRGPECKDRGGGTYRFVITNGAISGSTPNGSISGKVSGSGSGRWTLPAITDGAPVRYEGTLHGNAGSGRFTRFDGKCGGTFTARRG
jgi:uncharacterized caspase-like protein